MKEIKDKNQAIDNLRFIMRSIRAHNLTYLISPLLIFTPIGYFLDRYFHQRRTFLLISVGVSFIISQIILCGTILKIRQKIKKKYKKTT